MLSNVPADPAVALPSPPLSLYLDFLLAPPSVHTMPDREPTEDRQRALLDKLGQAARWWRNRLRYRGSMETADIVQQGGVALAGSPEYAEKLLRRPELLHGLADRLARNAVIDRLRRQRGPHGLEAGERVNLQTDAPAQDPSMDRRLDEARDQAWIREQLERLASGQTRARFRDPERMVTAFRLKQEGHTDAAIAEMLGVSKPAVNKWVQAVTAFLVARRADRERSP